MKRNSLRSYLDDPLLRMLMGEVKKAGPIHSSLLDITNKCNLRCTGCYYFIEEMNAYKKEQEKRVFNEFVDQETQRDINMMTIVGGEPALELERLRILAKHFKLTVVTNGSIPIPIDGLENIRIAISFWGDEQQDVLLRGNSRRKIFDQALSNYKNDKRAGFYYTVIPGHTENIRNVVGRMVANGNYITFNFYSDLAKLGNGYCHKIGYSIANKVINQVISLYPNRVVSSPYVNNIISKRSMLNKAWGYAMCPSITYDHPENSSRMAINKQYPTKFRAYNADLRTTRKCCIGQARDCDTCVDIWAITGWILSSMKAHLASKHDFTNWLCSTYIFYLQAGFIDLEQGAENLPEIYQKLIATRKRSNRISLE